MQIRPAQVDVLHLCPRQIDAAEVLTRETRLDHRFAMPDLVQKFFDCHRTGSFLRAGKVLAPWV
ncbi:hypothetical protein D3C86_1019640 [compost metagenome]